jgi:ribose transport system permease protein
MAMVAGVAMGILSGLAVGALNGFFVTVFKIPSFLVTLGSMQLIRGLDMRLTYTKPAAITNTTFTSFFGSGKTGPFPSLFIWSLIVVVICQIVLLYTTFGRQVLATGGNPVAARYSGVPVERTRCIVFYSAGQQGRLPDFSIQT